ncbi:MAG: GxGYxYP domain-containing protein, partial [bacterium]
MKKLIFLILLPISLLAQEKKIAIFYQPGFPYYMVSWSIKPDELANFMRKVGLQAELLNVQDLSNPQKFNAQKYAVLIHLYGNTFPLQALDNIIKFHREGGSIISTGVPFCHPCLAFPAFWSANVPIAQGDRRVSLSDDAHSGKWAVKIEKKGGDWIGIWSEKIPAKGGDTFILSAWVKSNDLAGGEDRLFLRFFSNGRFIGQDGPAIPKNAKEWTRISKTLTAPPGTTEVDVSPQLREEGSIVVFDDIELREGGEKRNLLRNPSFEEPGNIFIDMGHKMEYATHDFLGIGSFFEPPRTGVFELKYELQSGLALDYLSLPIKERSGWYQLLDENSLPKEDKVRGIIALYRNGKLEGYVTALIYHNCPQFKGAIDMWAGTQLFSPLDIMSTYLAQSILTQGTAFILQEKGFISKKRFNQIAELTRKEFKPPSPIENLTPIYLSHREKDFIPKPKEAPDDVYVADVRSLSLPEQFAFLSLEGLVNRQKPSLYLILNDRDIFWINWYLKRGLIRKKIELADPWQAFSIFKNYYKGGIIYDENLYSGIHLAMMLASLKDLIVANEKIAKRLNLPIKEDLRGRWKTTYESYEWAVKNILPKMDKRVVAFLYPQAPNVWDYVVAFKVFCFWITGWVDGARPDCDSVREKLAIEKANAQLPVNIPVLGFPWAGEGVGIQEGPGVSLGSQFAKFTVASTFTNISFHSGIKVKEFPKPKPPRSLQLDMSKNYATFLISDGDNITCWWGGFQPPGWDRAERGTIPLGWTLGPTATEFIPGIALYYLESATPLDCFLCAVSGIGYMYPDEYASRYKNPMDILTDFLNLTKSYIQKLGLQGCWTMGMTKKELIEKYAKILRVPLFPDYSRRGDMTYEKANYLIDGVPVFHALTNWGPTGREEAINFIVNQVEQTVEGRKTPCFVNVFILNWNYDLGMLKEIKERLERKNFIFVRPDELA